MFGTKPFTPIGASTAPRTISIRSQPSFPMDGGVSPIPSSSITAIGYIFENLLLESDTNGAIHTIFTTLSYNSIRHLAMMDPADALPATLPPIKLRLLKQWQAYYFHLLQQLGLLVLSDQ